MQIFSWIPESCVKLMNDYQRKESEHTIPSKSLLKLLFLINFTENVVFFMMKPRKFYNKINES